MPYNKVGYCVHQFGHCLCKSHTTHAGAQTHACVNLSQLIVMYTSLMLDHRILQRAAQVADCVQPM